MDTPFSNRAHAGEVLARSLARFAGRSDVIVLGLPKGGLPVAFEVAQSLALPLDLCLLEPITTPSRTASLGLLGWPPAQQLYEPILNTLGLDEEPLRQALARAWRRLRQRLHALRPAAPPPMLEGRTVLLVDEGAAWGFVLRDAAGLLRRAGARRLVAAVPVGSREGLRLLAPEFDELVCPWQPFAFDALTSFYGDFRPVTDEEARAWLLRAWREEGREEALPAGSP
jgi:putative phosphoribosyl transferase